MVTSPSTLLNPAMAFVSGVPSFNEFAGRVNAASTHDIFLLRTQNDLSVALSGFVSLVGHEYAKRYGFEENLSVLRGVKRSDQPEEELRSVKGALLAIGANLESISVPVNGRLVCGAALAVLRDEIRVTAENQIQFLRFPRVLPARLPDRIEPGHHDVENLKNPGEELEIPIPRNLTLENYREALEITSSEEAIPIITDPQQTPGRRILALKYWYFSLNGDVQVEAETANALLDIVIQEEWGDFQEFTLRIINNLLTREFKTWMELYLKRLFGYLSGIYPARSPAPNIDKIKELVKQLGGILYRHADAFQRRTFPTLGYELTVAWLLAISDPSMKWPPFLREEGFYLWSFIEGDHVQNGLRKVHKEIKKLAKTERDIGCLYNIVDRHIWQGRPLPTKMIQEIIDIICRRKDLTDEQKEQFRVLVKRDDDDAAAEVAASFWSRLVRKLWG